MRLFCLVLLILLASCSNTTNPPMDEGSMEFENIGELNNLPIPTNATEVGNNSTEDLKTYEVPQGFEKFNTAYREKLKNEDWVITEVESNKVIAVEKNNIKYLLFITKKSNSQVTNITVRQST